MWGKGDEEKITQKEMRKGTLVMLARACASLIIT